MTYAIKVNTKFNADEIRQELREADDIRGNVHEHIINLRDQGVRKALTQLGWTPPGEESVQNQLCARIDELERDKEVLAAQLDRAEEQLAMLRSQADALHRIGSTLDLDPGTDLAREAPARVEALAAHVAELTSLGRELRSEEDDERAAVLGDWFDRAMERALNTSLARLKAQAGAEARKQVTQEWELALPRLKAEWQADLLDFLESRIKPLHQADNGVKGEGYSMALDDCLACIDMARRQAEGGDHEN